MKNFLKILLAVLVTLFAAWLYNGFKQMEANRDNLVENNSGTELIDLR